MDTKKLFSLEGRVALVTGGSKNIGRMIAEGFLAQGAKVYISSRSMDEMISTNGSTISIPSNHDDF